MTTRLVRYDAARKALAEAHRVDDAKEIRDQAEALRAYARQRGDVEMERWLAEIKLRATVRIGELSAALERGQGIRTDRKLLPTGGQKFKAAVLESAGLSHAAAQRAEELVRDGGRAAVEEYMADQAAKGHTVSYDGALAAARRVQHRTTKRTAAAQTAALTGRFSVVLADPPWQYGATTVTGAADQHYATMPTPDICARPVREHVTKDAALFLWATNPLLPDALQVIAAWGFEYRTNCVWVKDKATSGLGVYVRGQHELLLIATRGTMIPDAGSRPLSVIQAVRTSHSAKPLETYALIERMYPGQRYVEMFARGRRDGWLPWGAEAA